MDTAKTARIQYDIIMKNCFIGLYDYKANLRNKINKKASERIRTAVYGDMDLAHMLDSHTFADVNT